MQRKLIEMFKSKRDELINQKNQVEALKFLH